MSDKNYYEILGVSRIASKEEIHKAYRKMIKKVHADINDSPNATEEMRNVIDAYKILSDEDKRKEYDKKLQQEEIKRQKVERPKSTVHTWTTTGTRQPKKSSISHIKINFINFINIDHNATNYDFDNKNLYIKKKRENKKI